MQQVLKGKEYNVEDYLTLEESGDVRHEFINGNLLGNERRIKRTS